VLPNAKNLAPTVKIERTKRDKGWMTTVRLKYFDGGRISIRFRVADLHAVTVDNVVRPVAYDLGYWRIAAGTGTASLP
jgi:hypothetical protein